LKLTPVPGRGVITVYWRPSRRTRCRCGFTPVTDLLARARGPPPAAVPRPVMRRLPELLPVSAGSQVHLENGLHDPGRTQPSPEVPADREARGEGSGDRRGGACGRGHGGELRFQPGDRRARAETRAPALRQGRRVGYAVPRMGHARDAG